MSHKLLSTTCACLLLAGISACQHDSLEDRAEKETREYTQRYCPTPVQNMQMTDSVSFTRATKTFNYYYKLCGEADNEQVIRTNKGQLYKLLLNQLRQDTKVKAYKDAGYRFHYIYRSQTSNEIVLETTYSQKDYR